MELEYGISAGIRLKSIGTDLVPIQEEHEARLEYRINLDTWANMDFREKAIIVAVRRNKMAMQNIHTEAEIRASERKINQGRKR